MKDVEITGNTVGSLIDTLYLLDREEWAEVLEVAWDGYAEKLKELTDDERYNFSGDATRRHSANIETLREIIKDNFDNYTNALIKLIGIFNACIGNITIKEDSRIDELCGGDEITVREIGKGGTT